MMQDAPNPNKLDKFSEADGANQSTEGSTSEVNVRKPNNTIQLLNQF
jgi:hypothetical protein